MAIAGTLRFIRDHPLTRHRRGAAIARYIGWQVLSRLRREVEVDWIGGTRMVVRRGMAGFTGNIYCGLHEFADMAFLLHLLRPGDMFLDVGANVGSYTVLASGVVGARTIAFEPDPRTAAFLKRNVDANGLDGQVTIHQAALSDKEGVVAFTMGLDTMNQVAEAGAAATRRVPTLRLDDVAGAREAEFMKLDVEGHEEHVLAGAGEVLGQGRLMAVETESLAPGVIATLNRHGFERAFYDPRARRLSREPMEETSANGLFVRDWQRVSDRLAAAQRRKVLDQLI